MASTEFVFLKVPRDLGKAMSDVGLAIADLIDVKYHKKVQVVVTDFDIEFINIEQLQKLIDNARQKNKS